MANDFFRARKGITVANSSASANLSPTTLTIGSTVANSTGVYTGVVNATTVNSATLQVGALFTANATVTNAAAINITGQVNTATFHAATSANVGANVQLTTVQLKVGNTIANQTVNSIASVISNASSVSTVTPASFTVGNTTANLTINSTAMTIANSTVTFTQNPNLLSLGNSTANVSANSILLRVVNATFSANLSPSTLFIPNITMTGALSANGGVGSGSQVLKSDGTKAFWADPAATAAAGADKEVQYNAGGAFGANSLFTFTVASTTLALGNTTANVQANSIIVRVINATPSANLSPAGLVAPNVAISGMLSANGGIGSPGQILKTDGSAKCYWADQSAANPAGTNRMIQINDNGSFGANAWFTFDITTSTMVIGNSSINTVANSTLIKVANSTSTANLDPVQLVIGTSTVNNVVIAAGANVVLGVNDLRVGNSSVNTYANSSMVRVTSATGSANITPTNILVSNVTLTGALSANGGVGGAGEILKSDGTKTYWGAAPAGLSANGSDKEIQYNASGNFAANNQLTFDYPTGTFSVGNVGSNVQANSTQLKVANSTATANLSPLALSIGIAKVNATMVVVGSNVLISSADMKIGNSSANTTQNSVIFQVANATSTANLDPIQLVIGTSKVNATARVVGANVTLDATSLVIGNTSVNTTVTSLLLRVSDTTSNVVVAPAAITIGNNSANVMANSTSIRVVNATSSANLDPSQMTVGVSKVNTSTISVSGNVILDATTVKIGNSSVNVTMNSTSFTGTANNALYLGGQAAVDYVAFDDLTGFQTEAGLSSNVATMTANYAYTANNANNASYLGGAPYADFQLKTGLAANVTTMTANNTLFVGTVSADNVVSNSQLSSNLALFQTLAGLSSNVVKLTANAAGYLGTVAAAGYQTTAGLSGNVATMTANNANYLGGTYYTAWQTAAGLAANVLTMSANNATYLGGVHYGDYQTEAGLAANVATFGYANTSSPSFSTVIWVGANVSLNTTAITIGNVASNLFSNSSVLLIGNSVNRSIVNGTAVAVGAINSTSNGVVLFNNTITIGNSSVVSTVNSTIFTGTSYLANNAAYLGGTAAAGYQTTAGLSANVLTMSANNASYLGGIAASNYVRKDTADQSITGGGTVTILDLGSISSGTVTPDPGDRPMQKYTNAGAHTLAPSANTGSYLLDIICTGGAGTVTTTGWTKTAGDSLTTPLGLDKFRCHCSITSDASLLQVQKLT